MLMVFTMKKRVWLSSVTVVGTRMSNLASVILLVH
jgi:hypothetical protein